MDENLDNDTNIVLCYTKGRSLIPKHPKHLIRELHMSHK